MENVDNGLLRTSRNGLSVMCAYDSVLKCGLGAPGDTSNEDRLNALPTRWARALAFAKAGRNRPARTNRATIIARTIRTMTVGLVFLALVELIRTSNVSGIPPALFHFG